MFVLNESFVPEFIHEETDPTSSGADHLCKSFLIDSEESSLDLPSSPVIGQR